MLEAIVATLTQWVNAFVELIVDLFTSMTGIFWVEGVGEAAGTLTLPGILALMSVAIGLIYLGLRFLFGLFPGARRL